MDAKAEYSNKQDHVIAFFKNLPGIELVDASFAEEFYDFINNNYTKKIKIEYHLKTGYQSNFQILFAEIKETENYKKITEKITEKIIKQAREKTLRELNRELKFLSENLKKTYIDKVVNEINEDATKYYRSLEKKYEEYDAVIQNQSIIINVDLWIKSENYLDKYRNFFLEEIYFNEFVDTFYEENNKSFQDFLIQRLSDAQYLNQYEIKELVKNLLKPYMASCIIQNKCPEFEESCNEFSEIKTFISSQLDIQLPQQVDSFYKENENILKKLFAQILPDRDNLLKKSIAKYIEICKKKLIEFNVDNFTQWLATVAFEPGSCNRRLDSFTEEYKNLDKSLTKNVTKKVDSFYNTYEKNIDTIFTQIFKDEYTNRDPLSKKEIIKNTLEIFASIYPNILTIDNLKSWLNFYSNLNLKSILEKYIARLKTETSVTPLQTIYFNKLNVLYKIYAEHLKRYFSERVFLKEIKFLDGADTEKIIRKMISSYTSKAKFFPIDSVVNWCESGKKDKDIETFENWANVFRNNTNNNDASEWYAELKKIVNNKKLKILRANFEHLYLKRPTDQDLEKLFFIFDEPINKLNNNIHGLINFFDEIHKQGDTGVIFSNFDIDIKKHMDNFFGYFKRSCIQNSQLRKVAYSQAFLHRFGFLPDSHGSTTTESLNVALTIDNAEIAGNIRNFFHSILLPLQPLAKEWFVLIPSEKNWLIIGLRLLIPILIASVIIALGFLLISFIVSMPAVFELLMIIPLTYFGFFAASMCIVMRDYTYDSFMNFIYSGQYNRPIYQVNQNLKEKFGEDLAIKIRDYYVDELKESEFLRKQFLSISQDSNKMCNEENFGELANSALRKEELSAEWSVLTGHQQPEEIAVDELKKKLKERIMLDSKTIACLSAKKVSYKQERDNYITSYCQKMSNCQNYTFFHDAPLTQSKKQYAKLEQLREINSGLENISPSV